ncbi:MAG: peptidyl-alpha-hydroxyglycine alpha-amidating lyase family protein [bacterium]
MNRIVCAVLVCITLPAAAAVAQQPVPEIRFDANIDFLKLPPTMHLGEVAGVAVNKTGHVFVFSRTGTRSTMHGQSSAQLFEFDRSGVFQREIGKDLYGFAFAHTVRIDRDDNIWATDEGTNMVMKFNPAGRVTMVLGRREESVETPAPRPVGAPALRPGWGTFNRPTDVTWDKDGNVYIADGYNNSRVVKTDKNGRWVKTWGDRGTDPGQFNILHSIASDAQGNIYVGDRTNRRIQVFDTDGKFLRQFTIDVPFTKPPNVMVGAAPESGANPLSASGAPWAICITPPPHQVLFSSDAVPGRIYKVGLDGTMLGVLGEAGKERGQFGWIHEIACPSERELYVAELLNWRVQKLTLH